MNGLVPGSVLLPLFLVFHEFDVSLSVKQFLNIVHAFEVFLCVCVLSIV